MKEYFSRAIEIIYYPDNDKNGGRKFRIDVTAYSGVGNGATFYVDVDECEVVIDDDVNVYAAMQKGEWKFGKEMQEGENDRRDDFLTG